MKRLTFLIVLVLAALVIVACGGGGGGEDAGGAGPTSLTFAGFDDFSFDPNSASAPAGSEVTVTLENEGVLEHSWVLVSDQADPATVTDADAIGGASTGSVPAGESNSITFTAPPAGTYQYVCTVPGHAAGGMVGTLTVSP
jgi:nitrite reductase (NO-forming)